MIRNSFCLTAETRTCLPNRHGRRADVSLIFLQLFLVTLILVSCNQSTNKTSTITKEVNKPAMIIPDFNADSAFLFVKRQVDYGPRVPNTPAHTKCADWLVRKLKSYCKNVVVQTGKVTAYNGTSLNFDNIIASFHPESSNRILICSHWDSRPYADHDPDPANHQKAIDGANDGASGVGIIIEIARILNQTINNDTNHVTQISGVDLLLVDAEDYGPPQDKKSDENTERFWGLGSQYWANNPHVANYKAKFGILLDMVGAPDATFLMEGLSMDYAPGIVRYIWSMAAQAGYSNYFISEGGSFVTDDHLFINKFRNIPTIDIIHLDKTTPTGFYPFWHTMKDNLASIDKNTLKAVGQTLLTVIYNER